MDKLVDIFYGSARVKSILLADVALHCNLDFINDRRSNT